MDLGFFATADGLRIDDASELNRFGLSVTCKQRKYPGGRAYGLSVYNRSDRTIFLERAGASMTVPRSRKKRQWRVFLDKGGCGWCGVKRLETLQPDPRIEPVREQQLGDGPDQSLTFHRSNLQTVVWDARSGAAALVGFLRQRYGHNYVDVVPNSRTTDIARIEAWQEFGIELGPGQTQELDVLAVAEGEDPYTLLDSFGMAVQRHCELTFDEPPSVGMMTWYGYRTAIDEEIILENAAIIGELFGGYPQQMQKMMLLDHGWQEDANWGEWSADAKRFSHGMAWLNKRLKKDGLELGLWYTPFCLTDNVAGWDQYETLLARDGEGRVRSNRASVWGQLPGHPGSRDVAYFDGALMEVQKKWRRELEQMKRWGCVYWKLDFFALQTSADRQKRLGTGELYARTWTNFRKAVGIKGHMAPCSCGTNIQLGYNDSVRIGSDIGNSGYWPGAMDTYRYGLATIAALWYKHRRFWINDADSIQIGKGCSLGEARVRATMVSLSGGHVMVSEDLRSVDPARLEVIRRILPAFPHAARPLDLFENPFPEGYPALWALTTRSGLGRMTALAVFNLEGKARKFRITPEMLGIDDSREFVALEWWQQRWLGRFTGGFELEVPPEDVAVIHARPTRSTPGLVSVSHHITGNYIVEQVAFDRGTGMLNGVLATRPELRVVLFGQTSPAWRLAPGTTYHGAANPFGGWQHELVTSGQQTPFAIAFVRAPTARSAV
jgi:hypothetical protein